MSTFLADHSSKQESKSSVIPLCSPTHRRSENDPILERVEDWVACHILGRFAFGSGGYYFSIGWSGRDLAEQFSGEFLGLSSLRDLKSLSFPDVNIAVFTILLPKRGGSFSGYWPRYDQERLKI